MEKKELTLYPEDPINNFLQMTTKQMKLRVDILLNTHSALLGRISSNVRMISIAWGETYFYLKAFFDRNTTDEDFEDFDAVSAEVIAAFPNITQVKVEVIYNNAPLAELPGLKEMVFLRKGELNFEE